MKTCPNCGKQLNDEETYCDNCGYDYNNPNKFEIEDDEKKNHKPKRFVSKINYGPNLFKDDGEFTLLDDYIVSNAPKMKNGFSLPTFLFGAIYMFYRKMWVLGIITIIFDILISFFVPNELLVVAIHFAYCLIFGFAFKDLYLQKALKDIDAIKAANPDASEDELTVLVSDKGGVSNITLIIAVVGTVIFVIFNAVALLTGFKTIGTSFYDLIKARLQESKKSFDQLDNMYREKKETRVVGKLYMIFPKGYKASNDIYEDNATFYNRTNCKITTIYYDAEIYGNDLNAYLDSKTSQSEVTANLEYKNMTIHGQKWTMVKSLDTIPKYITYASMYEDKIYDVTFETEDEDNELCLFNSEIASTSLRFRDK